MLSQTYQFSLNYDIQPGLAVTGRIFQDVNTAVLICVTNIGKVLIYTPRTEGAVKDQNSSQFLNLNKKIKFISISQFKSETSPSEKLILASENTLIVYDVEKNLELFYKEVQDGITAVCHGEIAQNGSKSSKGKEMALVGGDCTLQGFDQIGEEAYWNVTGDQVSSMFAQPSQGDKPPLLLVGSSDYSIRVFCDEEILFQIQLNLTPIQIIGLSYTEQLVFAYALENGNIGVYKHEKLLWQSRDSIKSIAMVQGVWELDSQESFRPLLIGREDGTIEIRRDQTGDLIYKHASYGIKLSALLFDDLRGIQQKQLIAVYQDGSVRGFSIGAKDQNQVVDPQKLNEIIEQLNEKKNEISAKIQALSNRPDSTQNIPIIQKNCQVLMGFGVNSEHKYVDLVLQSNVENTYIKQAILFADSLFLPYDSYIFTASQPSQTISIPLPMVKFNLKEEIRSKILISSTSVGTQHHILESRNVIPKFVNFQYVHDSKNIQRPQSQLTTSIKERIPRYLKWVDQCFIIDDKNLQRLETGEELHMVFQNTRNQEVLCIDVNSLQGKVIVSTDSIELAGEIIQDICNFLNLTELSSMGEFPLEMAELNKLIIKVEQFKTAKLQLSADVAEAINNIKTLVVQAEDSRMVANYTYMQKMYSNIMVQNGSLQSEMLKKNSNNDGLMEALRQINYMIAKGSELRLGQAKSQLISMCRNAVKKNNLYQLINIIQYGKEI